MKRLCLTDFDEYSLTVYTDSYSDRPIIEISHEAYMIDNKTKSVSKIR